MCHVSEAQKYVTKELAKLPPQKEKESKVCTSREFLGATIRTKSIVETRFRVQMLVTSEEKIL